MVLKGLIFVSCYFLHHVVDLNGLVLVIFIFGGVGGLERTDFGLLANFVLSNHYLYNFKLLSVSVCACRLSYRPNCLTELAIRLHCCHC